MTDIFAFFALRWRETGYRGRMGGHLLQLVAWAGDAWLPGESSQELSELLRDLEEVAAARHAGMSPRLAK